MTTITVDKYLQAFSPKSLGNAHIAYLNDKVSTTVSVGVGTSARRTGTTAELAAFGATAESNVPNAMIVMPGNSSTTIRSQPAIHNAPASGFGVAGDLKTQPADYSYQTAVGNLFTLFSVKDPWFTTPATTTTPAIVAPEDEFWGTSVHTSSSCAMHIQYIPRFSTTVQEHYLLESKIEAHSSLVSFSTGDPTSNPNFAFYVRMSGVSPSGVIATGYDYKCTVRIAPEDATTRKPFSIAVDRTYQTSNVVQPCPEIAFTQVTTQTFPGLDPATNQVLWFAHVGELIILVTADSIGYQVRPSLLGSSYVADYFHILTNNRTIQPKSATYGYADKTIHQGVAVLPLNHTGSKAYVAGMSPSIMFDVTEPFDPSSSLLVKYANILFDYATLSEFAYISDIAPAADVASVRWHPISSVPFADAELVLQRHATTTQIVAPKAKYSQFVTYLPEPVAVLVHHACMHMEAYGIPSTTAGTVLALHVGQINAEASLYPDIEDITSATGNPIDYLFSEFIKRRDATRVALRGSAADVLGQVYDGSIENDVVNAIVTVDDVVSMFENAASELNSTFSFMGRDVDCQTYVPLRIVNVMYQNTKDAPLLCTNWGTQWIPDALVRAICTLASKIPIVIARIDSVLAGLETICPESCCTITTPATTPEGMLRAYRVALKIVKSTLSMLMTQVTAMRRMPTEAMGESILSIAKLIAHTVPAPVAAIGSPTYYIGKQFRDLEDTRAAIVLANLSIPSPPMTAVITASVGLLNDVSYIAGLAFRTWNEIPQVDASATDMYTVTPVVPSLGQFPSMSDDVNVPLYRTSVDVLNPSLLPRPQASYRYVCTTPIAITVDVDCTTAHGTIENPCFAIRPLKLDAQAVVDSFAAKLRSTTGPDGKTYMEKLNLEDVVKGHPRDRDGEKLSYLPSCPYAYLLALAFGQRHNIMAQYCGKAYDPLTDECATPVVVGGDPNALPPLANVEALVECKLADGPQTAADALANLSCSPQEVDPIASSIASMQHQLVHKLPVLIKAGGTFSGPPAKIEASAALPPDTENVVDLSQPDVVVENPCCCPTTVDYDRAFMRRAMLLVHNAIHDVCRPIITDVSDADEMGPQNAGKAHNQRPLYSTFFAMDDVSCAFMADRTLTDSSAADTVLPAGQKVEQNVFETYWSSTYFNTFHRQILVDVDDYKLDVNGAETYVGAASQILMYDPPAIGTIINKRVVAGVTYYQKITSIDAPTAPQTVPSTSFADSGLIAAGFGELAPDNRSIALNKLQTLAIQCMDTLLYIPLNSPLAFGIVARWRRKTADSRQFYLEKIDLTYDNRQFATTSTQGSLIEDPTDSVPTEEDLLIGPSGEISGDSSFAINLLLKSLRKAKAALKAAHPELNNVPVSIPVAIEADAYGMVARRARV